MTHVSVKMEQMGRWMARRMMDVKKAVHRRLVSVSVRGLSSSSSSSLSSSRWRPALLALLHLLIQLPYWFFSSDPSLFLPAKPRKKPHHHGQVYAPALSFGSGSGFTFPPPQLSPVCGGSGGGMSQRRRASADRFAGGMHARTPSADTAIHKQTNGTVNASPTNVSAVAAVASNTASNPAPLSPSPPPTPSLPFLSPHSFPIPSNQLVQASVCYNLDSFPGSTPSSVGNVASAAAHACTSGATTMGGAMAANSQDAATTVYQHVLKKKKKKKYTLVLDLDETLVHTTDRRVAQYDCRVEIHTKKAHRVFYILKRPFLDVFLVTMSQYFEIVIFTASIRRYADAVIDLIDLHHVVDRRFFRQSCIKSGGSFLKDLHVVSSDLRKVLILDNSPIAYSLQEENAIPISTWYDDATDTCLRDLIPFLLAMRAMDDVRTLLYRRSVRQRAAEKTAWSQTQTQTQAPQLSKASAIVEEDENDEQDETHSSNTSRFGNINSNTTSTQRSFRI